jgi:hypothetical protein
MPAVNDAHFRFGLRIALVTLGSGGAAAIRHHIACGAGANAASRKMAAPDSFKIVPPIWLEASGRFQAA